MNKENFTSYLENPSKLYQLSYQELKSLVLQYPYCQNLHLLLLKKSMMDGNGEQEHNLKTAAVYSLKRSFLFQQLQAIEKTSEPEENVILQDDFLELKDLSSLEHEAQKELIEISLQDELIKNEAVQMHFDLPNEEATLTTSLEQLNAPIKTEHTAHNSIIDTLLEDIEDEEGDFMKTIPSSSKTNTIEWALNTEPGSDSDEETIEEEEDSTSLSSINELSANNTPEIASQNRLFKPNQTLLLDAIAIHHLLENLDNDKNILETKDLAEPDLEQPKPIALDADASTDSFHSDSFLEEEEDLLEEIFKTMPENVADVTEREGLTKGKSDFSSIVQSPIETNMAEQTHLANDLIEERQDNEEIAAINKTENNIDDSHELFEEWEDKEEKQNDDTEQKSDQTLAPPKPLPKSAFSSWKQFYGTKTKIKQKAKKKKKKKKKEKNPVVAFANQSLLDKDNVATETMAKILTMQEKYDEAIEMYEQLILTFPQKSTYFAEKIEDIKNNLK